MKYLAYHVTTTGPEPILHQMLAFEAALVDDGIVVDSFRVLFSYPTIHGKGEYLAKLGALIEEIERTNKNSDFLVTETTFGTKFHLWLRGYIGDEGIIFVCAEGSDYYFLDRVIGWPRSMINGRLDLGSMFFESTDKSVPTLEECKERAGVTVSGAAAIVGCVNYVLYQ